MKLSSKVGRGLLSSSDLYGHWSRRCGPWVLEFSACSLFLDSLGVLSVENSNNG